MMTRREWLAKQQIIKRLCEQGYPTYARLLDLFDVNLTEDPTCVAYMVPAEAKIVINSGLDIEQVSTITRHEILHEFFTHNERMIKHNGADKWSKRSQKVHELSNIAGDYDISNKGYTDADKRIARRIHINDEFVKGLVTEDDHPEWVDLSFEQMFDELMKEYRKEVEDAQKEISDLYAKGWNQAMQDYADGILDINNPIIKEN